MDLEQRIEALEQQFTTLTAKQIATEAALCTLANFIKRDPLLTEHVLQMACDLEADAMQQDGSAPALLPAFLEAIASWNDRLQASANTLQGTAG